MADSYPEIAGLDIAAGISATSGDYDEYMYILKTYYRNMERQVEDIANALDDNNITDYTILVHALKSSSRSVGAMELGEMAYELELCGKSGDVDTIKKKTPALMDAVFELKDNLSVLFEGDDSVEEIDMEDFIYMLESLKDYMADDDIILVNDMLEQIEGTFCNDNTAGLIDDIKVLALSMEYGRCIEVIDNFLASL